MSRFQRFLFCWLTTLPCESLRPDRTPLPCSRPPGDTRAASSGQAPPRHAGVKCLPLLPSGSGGVHTVPLRGTQPSTPLAQAGPERAVPSTWEFSPAIADCGYRARQPPHLARPGLISLTCSACCVHAFFLEIYFATRMARRRLTDSASLWQSSNALLAPSAPSVEGSIPFRITSTAY